MATTLLTTLKPGLSWVYESTADLDERTSKLSAPAEIELENGTAASKADLCFSDTRQLAASANEDLDLAGSLPDAFGTTLTFVKIKHIYIKAAAANTNSVIVKPASSNGFTGPFGAATHTLTIPPGGYIELSAPVSGWAVTAGTGDKINIANSAAGTTVDYDIIIVGTSA